MDAPLQRTYESPTQKCALSPAGWDTLCSFGSDVFEKLGSWEMLSAVVSSMYSKLFNDERTRAYFENANQSKVMSHMTGFLSCALGGKMVLSPKQLWLIHRDLLWHPSHPRASPAPAAAALPSSCPMPHAHSPTGAVRAAASARCPMADNSRSGLPPLCPAHVSITIEMLRESLLELNARQELINEMAKLLHGVAWVFERGDIFHDPQGKEEQWQNSNQRLRKVALSRGSSMSECVHVQHAKRGMTNPASHGFLRRQWSCPSSARPPAARVLVLG